MFDSTANNSHTQFIVNASVDGEQTHPDWETELMPLFETYDVTEIGRQLIAGDYEGVMSVTVVATGDVVDTEVTYHITTDGLVDVERA